MSMITLNVSEFNQIMTDIIQNQLNLSQLCIQGEVSQFNLYAKQQHLYVTLTHEKSSLQCVIYNQHLKDIPVIKKGDVCQMIGHCRYSKNKGQLIFSGVHLRLIGTGNQLQAVERLKQSFEKQGYLTKQTTDMLPMHMDHVCIITAQGSAAYHDIESIITTNDHTFKTSIIPATMQGILAPGSIQQALQHAQAQSPDLICISRGGGAEEDFACFNNETLCKTVANSHIPIITGIGHQINTTLTCLCANSTFETPTAMAQYLCDQSMQPFHAIQANLQNVSQSIHTQLTQSQHTLALLQQAFSHCIQSNMDIINQTMGSMMDQLSLLNPIETLKKGYAVCTSEKNNAVHSIQQLKKNDIISLKFYDGDANATINHVNSNRTNNT
jgi:exodeoxyribonuclease VII large subunit